MPSPKKGASFFKMITAILGTSEVSNMVIAAVACAIVFLIEDAVNTRIKFNQLLEAHKTLRASHENLMNARAKSKERETHASHYIAIIKRLANELAKKSESSETNAYENSTESLHATDFGPHENELVNNRNQKARLPQRPVLQLTHRIRFGRSLRRLPPLTTDWRWTWSSAYEHKLRHATNNGLYHCIITVVMSEVLPLKSSQIE